MISTGTNVECLELEEDRLSVFENRVVRKIIGPKMEEVTGAWVKLHKEELHKLYTSPNRRI
jgi:hypothetical protein